MSRSHDRSAASFASEAGARIMRVMLVALIAVSVMGGECNPKSPDFFDPIDGDIVPGQGDIFGRVTLDGDGRSGVTVTVRQGSQVVATTTTDGNGDYEVLDLDPGTYTVSISTIPGATCPGEQTAAVVADDETQVDFACTSSSPTGDQIAANPYSLAGTIVGTDQCETGSTISNPGPITVQFASGFLIILSDADVRGTYVPGQPWTGTGETTISSGGSTFILRETATGTWQFSNGTIVLPGTLTFEFFSGGSMVCRSTYTATYTQLVSSSLRFKQEVGYLLPGGMSILGLRPVKYRYLAPYGDPAVLRIGLIAEEVARVFPDAVARDAEGRPAWISYDRLKRLVVEEIAGRIAQFSSTSVMVW